MKNTLRIIAAALFTCALFLSSCKKDDDQVDLPQPVINESEVITTMKLIFTDSATSAPAGEFVFRDTDGDGPNAPVEFDTITMNAGTTYLVEVILLNETAAPADTISNEVEEEANDHQFFFNITGLTATHAYLDQDTNSPPLPVGLSNKFRSGSIGTGSIQVILKHQPGTKDGLQTTGDTDVDVTFHTIVQ